MEAEEQKKREKEARRLDIEKKKEERKVAPPLLTPDKSDEQISIPQENENENMEASFKDVSEEDSIKSSELIEGSRKSCEVMNLSDVKIELAHR